MWQPHLVWIVNLQIFAICFNTCNYLKGNNNLKLCTALSTENEGALMQLIWSMWSVNFRYDGLIFFSCYSLKQIIFWPGIWAKTVQWNLKHIPYPKTHNSPTDRSFFSFPPSLLPSSNMFLILWFNKVLWEIFEFFSYKTIMPVREKDTGFLLQVRARKGHFCLDHWY